MSGADPVSGRENITVMFLLGVIVTLAGFLLVLRAVHLERTHGHLGGNGRDSFGMFLIGVLLLVVGPPLVLILGVTLPAW